MKHAIAYFHISDHLQLTMKSFHVLFPSISLFKKNTKHTQTTKAVSFHLQHFRYLSTKTHDLKLKIYKKGKSSLRLGVLFSKIKFETSNARCFSFLRAAMISKGVLTLRLFGRTCFAAGVGPAREFSEVSTLCGPPL